MQKLYEKSRLSFALFWILLYVVGTSLTDELSRRIGLEKSISMPWLAALSVFAFLWLRKRELTRTYGLCAPTLPPSRLLWYLPLVLLASVNLWLGVVLNLSILETVLYILSMFCVGFLEEVIFRGLLFKAMLPGGVKSAIIVSSLTFGIGHLVNLVNGSGADMMGSLLQVVYAVAAGFLFTILIYRTGSLLACIITHSVLNALSVFANEAAQTPQMEVLSAAALTVIALVYAVYVLLTTSSASGSKL